MKNINWTDVLTDPLVIAGVSGLNPRIGNQLAAGAVQSREQQHAQRQQQEFEMKKRKDLQEQQLEQALINGGLQGVDFNDLPTAIEELRKRGINPTAALPFISKIQEIQNAKEQLGISKGRLGVEQGHLGVAQEDLGLKRQKNAAEIQKLNSEALGLPDAEQEYKIGKDLREAGTKAASNYKFVRTAAKNVRSLSKIRTGASDTGMIYNTVNVLDPGNSVREGDVITVKNAPGLPEELRSKLNYLRGKGTITEKSRVELVELVNTVEGNHFESVKNINKENVQQAQKG